MASVHILQDFGRKPIFLVENGCYLGLTGRKTICPLSLTFHIKSLLIC